MIERKLKGILRERHCTLLGVGPMSKNCVDATIELANQYNSPLTLIASRRQIDSVEFGGGYVNNWDTKSFADYVNLHDKRGRILLARDHGGPWQNTTEVNAGLSLRDAMNSAKQSFAADIDAGFQVIHIDTSVDIHGEVTAEDGLERLFELYEFCSRYSQKREKSIIFEIGTEEQSGSTNSPDELEFTINQMSDFCDSNNLQKPTFVVIQAGTRVMEMRNVGTFEAPLRVESEIPAEIQLPKMIEICNRHGVLMKEHNTDYLSNEALRWHPRLGIHAANVAPEFGVCETKALIRICKEFELKSQLEKMMSISYESGKWKKWMLPSSNATDIDKAIIAGHYVFSQIDFASVVQQVRLKLKSSGVELDDYLKENIKQSIIRYMTNFRLMGVS
jgi:tagatose-1,6-bisphosphate aldolase non-catalytic subunit AgaZ/GatZ